MPELESNQVLNLLLDRFKNVESSVVRMETRLDAFKDEVRREIRDDFRGFKGLIVALAAIAAALVTPVVVWALERLN